jgi:hypothetical protein
MDTSGVYAVVVGTIVVGAAVVVEPVVGLADVGALVVAVCCSLAHAPATSARQLAKTAKRV